MDRDTKIEDLKKDTQKFCEEREWDQFHGIKDLAIGAATESAELLEIFRFQSEQQIDDLLKQPKQREAISDELADVLFFLLRISHKYGFDLAQAFAQKLEKNRIKYPIDKAKGQNTKYNQY
jgi:NTP pyrophosphatase (non-canonical NTP hydrolase)